MSDETTPHQSSMPDLPPPPSATAPPPAVTEAWASTGPAPKPRPTGLIAGAIALVLVVVAGVVAFSVLGGDKDSANAQPLALAFSAGQTETYTMHMTMDGQMELGELLGGSTPLDMEVTQVVTWEVESVDGDGVATISVTVLEMSGTVNGVAIPDEASSTPPMEIQVAPDGRILSAGGVSFAGADLTGGASFPGMGQMTPILPDEAVEPGDTWTEDFSQDIPFGEGTIEYTSTSTLERYEDVNGVNAAVVTTEYTVPMDFTIDFGKLLESMEGAEGIPTGATGFGQAQIAYGGEGAFTQTAWVDTEAGEMVKMTSSGSFDMTMAFTGLDIFEGQEVGFSGEFTQDLTRG